MKNSMKQLALVSAITALTAGSANAANYSSRIIGGADAPADTYPWMVSVQSKEAGEHFCGGSLIAGNYVLTAAHCIEDTPAEEIQVVVSEFDLESNSASEETIGAKNIFVHEGYGDENDNDIAIIELQSSTSKSPVQLADATLMSGLAVGSNLTVMGWGNMESEGESFPNILQEVQVPLADHQQCKTNYENVNMAITDNMICAGLPEGGKDSCQGDSGGPLVYQKDSNWFQTGVVSFGEGCAEENYFGVYTKVSNYGDWIAKVQAGEVTPYEPVVSDQDDWEDSDDWGDYADWEDHTDLPDDGSIDGEGDFEDWEAWAEYEGDEFGEGDEFDDEFDEEQAFGIPAYIGFLATEDDETIEESLFVFNTNESPLTIQSISLDNDQNFSVIENGCDAATLNSEEECEVVIGFNVSDEEYHEANLSISTSDEEHASVQVALFGEVFNELELDDAFDGMDGLDEEEWFFDGDDAWTGDVESGAFTLAVDSVSENDEATLMTMLEGPGVLEFDMSLTDDAAGNTLNFLVDGEVVTTLSSERANKSHSVDLSEGEHEIAWIYRKTEQSGAGAEATISDIEFEPEHDAASEGDEDALSGDDLDSVPNDEEVQDAVETIADAISGAGSTDAFLLALLALFGFAARSRK